MLIKFSYQHSFFEELLPSSQNEEPATVGGFLIIDHWSLGIRSNELVLALVLWWQKWQIIGEIFVIMAEVVGNKLTYGKLGWQC